MKKILFLFALLCCSAFPLVAADGPAPAARTEKAENWKKLFGNDLFDAEGKKVSVSNALKSRKYVGIYSSASWCGPCRIFTPKLLEFAEKNKGKIDIVLLGFHWTKEDVCKYMKKYKMPWAGTYRTENVEAFVTRHRIEGIPDFKVFTHAGELVINDGYDLSIVQRLLDGKQ